MNSRAYLSVVAVLSVLASAAAAHAAESCDPHVAHATPPAASRQRALDLLGSVTQLLSPLGRPVLAANLATTVALNNRATPAQRAQALKDAQVTAANAYALADGLGATMGDTYRRLAPFASDDDGATIHAGQVGPAVAALFHAAEVTSGGDSGQGKYAFARGSEVFGGGTYQPPPDGVLDVLGKAYGFKGGRLGPGCGDPRPFLVAPVGAASGPSIQTFDGIDLFGVPANSRIMLEGVPAAQPGHTGSNLVDSPSYPSGHTTFAYTEALLLAMMVPERYRALAYRASEYGNSRIVIGAHWAVDVIGGRTLATYDLAQNLAGTPGYAQVPGGTFRAALAVAARELRAALQGGGCPIIAACAAKDPIVRAADAAVLAPVGLRTATAGEAYAFHLNYGLPAIGPETRSAEAVPVEAAGLLATRFPYLTSAQRVDILFSTEAPSGRFLDASPVTGRLLIAGLPGPQAEAGAYSRLDLFAAAGGYAAFGRQVVVDQDVATITDPDLAPFADVARDDTWSNDIGGPGGLTKRGAGRLVLAGTDTYQGATIVEGGTLEVAGSIRSATTVAAGATLAGSGRFGDVSVASGGTLAPGAKAMTIDGKLELAPGARLRLASPTPGQGGRVAILTARGGVTGTFASVEPAALARHLTYTRDGVFIAFGNEGRTTAK